MKYSFSTGSLYHLPVGTSLRLAQNLGFDGVELALGPDFLFRGAQALRREAEKVGVQFLSMHPPFKSLPGWKQYSALTNLKAIATARMLDIPNLVIHDDWLFPIAVVRDTPPRELLERYLSACRNDVHMRIENLYKDHGRFRHKLINDQEDLVELGRRFGLTYTLDTAHVGMDHGDLSYVYQLMRGSIGNIHVSDYNRTNHKEHRFPGEGNLPLTTFLRSLAHDHYEGLLTLEIAPSQIKAWSIKQAEERLATALDFVKRYTRASGVAEESTDKKWVNLIKS